MSERTLLATAIADRGSFDAFAEHVDTSDFTVQGRLIFESIAEYYERDKEARSVDGDILRRSVQRKVPNPKHHTAFTELLGRLCSLDVSPKNVVTDFIHMKLDVVGNKLAAALASGDDSRVAPLLAEYGEWSETTSIGDDGDELSVVSAPTFSQPGLDGEAVPLMKLYPKALNERLGGGLRAGHHVIAFARPEMGKTAFVINALYGFLQQDLRVLYLGNEDPLQDIIERIYSRLAGMTIEECYSDEKTATERAKARGIGNLMVKHMEPGTPSFIDGMVEKFKPHVTFIDQLRNVKVKEDGLTQQLEQVAKAVRNTGQRHKSLMVSITQAGGSADGKAVLDMTDVDSSKTGIPAQADVMIGIGATSQDEEQGRRVLSLCKNKRTGQHDVFPVRVDLAHSKVTSI